MRRLPLAILRGVSGFLHQKSPERAITLDMGDAGRHGWDMSITLKQLEAFVWVAQLRSFKGAAERLNTTQPNISARIAMMEEQTDAPLFLRRFGKVELTPQGQELLPWARKVLYARDDFSTHANATRLTEGTLRLGVTEMVVHSFLRNMMGEIRKTFPNLVVELTVEMAAELEKSLAKNQLDLALMNGPFQFQAAGVVLGEYPMVWVASPNLRLDTGEISKETLAMHPILTHARGTWVHQAIASHFQGTAATLVPSSNLAVCQQMAVDGMGIAALPMPMVTREIAQRELILLDHDWHPAPLNFEARFSPDHPSKTVAAVAKIAAQVAKAV